MDKWREYFWYLLPSPLKLVKKKLNQWYIFFRVIGDEYDRVQAELERASDETNIATCSDVMLPYFADDRGLSRYPGETNDSFRSRIAMFDELEELGGTREGIILAAASIGYRVDHVWLPRIGQKDRWASFLIIAYENLNDDLQLDFSILKREVRDKKESTSQDYYEKVFTADIGTAIWSEYLFEAELWTAFWIGQRRLDGSRKLDGSRLLKGTTGNLEYLPDFLAEIQILPWMYTDAVWEHLLESRTQLRSDAENEAELWTAFWIGQRRLDGSRKLDGSRLLRGTIGNAELSAEWHLGLTGCIPRMDLEWGSETDIWTGMHADTEGDTIGGGCFYLMRRLDGKHLLNGDRKLSSQPGLAELHTDVQIDTVLTHSLETGLNIVWESRTAIRPELLMNGHDDAKFWIRRTLDGSKKLAGEYKLDAAPGKAEYWNDTVYSVPHSTRVEAYIGNDVI